MRKQFVAIGIAVLVGAAGLLAVFLLQGDAAPKVTLNEVLTRLEQVDAYSYHLTMTSAASEKASGPVGQAVAMHALMSSTLGIKISRSIADPNAPSGIVNEKYLPSGQERLTTLLPQEKQYIELICDANYAGQMRREHDDPGTAVRQLLACEVRFLGPSTIEGVAVEGFQTTDLAYLAGARGDGVEVTLWIDTATKLPHQLEKTVSLPEGRQLRNRVTGIQWDLDVEAAAFAAVIPADYKSVSGGALAMPKANERTALKGLEFLATLGGVFPAQLDIISLMKDVARYERSDMPAAQALRKEKNNMTKEGRMKRMIEIMMPIKGLSDFYKGLKVQGKDPVYAGGEVKPGDKEGILLSWTVMDGVHKVVYGTLQVETIPTARLAVLMAKPTQTPE